MPVFSIVIPVKPDGTVTALAALRNLDLSSQTFEILVAEGRHPSRQRNAAVAESLGDIIYFLDDDALVSPDHLEICASVMADPKVAVAGGPSLTPVDDSPLQQLFGAALTSLFGAAGVRSRYRAVGGIRETTDRELILCNMAIRKDMFLAHGGFDERLYPNEENELLARVLASGHKLLHVPQMSVQRSQRKTLEQFVRQMFSYGRGRAEQTLISGSVSVVSFIPLVFVCYLALLFFAPFNPLLLLPLVVYLVLNTIYTLSSVFTSGVMSRVLLFFIFPLLHMANGCGLFWGLAGGVRGISRSAGDEIVVKRIKTFEQVLW